MESIPVESLLVTQPYIGRPEQLADMVKSIMQGGERRGDQIQIFKTERGLFLYDGNCWSCATYFSSERGGRSALLPSEFQLYELGTTEKEIDLWIKGKAHRYHWDGEGKLTKGGASFNLFTEEKIRDMDGNRKYQPKTIVSLADLANKYRAVLARQEGNEK